MARSPVLSEVEGFAATAGRALRTASGKAESRARLIKAVRAACRRLGIDDDDRRRIQLDVTGKASMSDMELPEFGKLLDHLNRDWKGPMGHRSHVGKIRALWWTLYWLGAIAEPGESGLAAFVKRQTGIERIAFLGSRQAHSVIEALKAWAAREGVVWKQIADPAEAALADRRAVLDALAARLRDRGSMRGSWIDYCRKTLGLGLNHLSWTARELDAAIRLLGKQHRRAIGREHDHG